jgi:hypothetical protein
MIIHSIKLISLSHLSWYQSGSLLQPRFRKPNLCHHCHPTPTCPHPLHPPPSTLSMATTPTAESSKAAADPEVAEAARVTADREATTATAAAADDACTTSITEATHLVAMVDKLEVYATCARQEATRVRAALAAVSPPEESAIIPPPPPRDDDVFRAYVAAQAHVVVATLHAQAISILNIKAMIPLVFP